VVQSTCSEVSSMFATILVDSMPIPLFSYAATGLNVEFINESVNATSYVWNFGVENSVSGEVNPSFEYLQSGQYNVQLVVSNGRCEASYSQIINLTDDYIEELNGKLLFVYPNPTNGKIAIQLENKNAMKIDFYVVDIMGREVYPKTVSQIVGQLEVDLSILESGIYILNTSIDQKIQQYKIVIKK